MRWPGFGASDLDAAGRAGFGAAGFAADAAGAAGVARGAGVGEAAGAAGFLAGAAGFLDSDALLCALEAKAFLSLRATGGSTVDDAGLHEFAHRLKFVQNSLAVNAKFLGKFIYACFRHSILLSWAARIRARPLLIHGELVPSHRATMFVIPRLFPGHDGMNPTLWIIESSILKPVD